MSRFLAPPRQGQGFFDHPERSFPGKPSGSPPLHLRPPLGDGGMTHRADGVQIPGVIETATGSGNDVIRGEGGSVAAPRPRTFPAVPLRHPSYETAIGFLAVSKCRRRDIRAKCLRAHEVEDFDVAQGFPRQTFECLSRFGPGSPRWKAFFNRGSSSKRSAIFTRERVLRSSKPSLSRV